MMYMLMALLMLCSLSLVSNTMIFVVWLMLNIIILVYFLVMQYFLPGFLGLLFLMVYLGAMMILIGYVCAITPFAKFNNYSMIELLFLFIICVMVFMFSLFSYFPLKLEVPTSHHLSTFFFTAHGVLLFYLIVVMMLLILLLATNSASFKAPFRLM